MSIIKRSFNLDPYLAQQIYENIKKNIELCFHYN